MNITKKNSFFFFKCSHIYIIEKYIHILSFELFFKEKINKEL